MKKRTKTVTPEQKEIIKASVRKMIEDKASVRSFLKGEITIQELKQKGITLARPI